LLAVAALALGAAACGGDDDAGESPPPANTSDSTAVSSPNTSGSPTTTSTTESPGSADAATKVVGTPMGEVEVPTDPQRIVVLWGATLSSVVQLGFEPVAAFGRDGDNSNLAPYLPEGYPLDTLEVVAAPREVNFEAVTAVEPDLILGGDVPHLSESYDQLSAIAPTVLLSWEGTASWRTMLTDVADVLGVPERAAEAVQEYEAHVADVREAIGLEENPMTVSVVRIQSPEEIRVETPASFSGQIIADVGFTRPDNQLQPDADADYISLSLERIPDVDASTIIALYLFNDGDTSAAWDQIRTSPLWQALPAVQAGRVVEADFTNWSSSNYYAAHHVLDDISAAFSS
jgi:iron complex transport system substrate-binding protein